MGSMRRKPIARVVLVVCALFTAILRAQASTLCSEERTEAVKIDRAACAALAPAVRNPGTMPLDQYEAKLTDYLSHYCYRDSEAGWRRDKGVRDTGPFVPRSNKLAWEKDYLGTHQPVLIWYSKEMYDWLKANRPEDGTDPKTPTPIPDGAMMVKEMYSAPAASCGSVPVAHLAPTKEGVAVMVRAAGAAHDGWFWGAMGWPGWAPDWPAAKDNPYPSLGFGQYCLNCHASAADNQTFASLRNIRGEMGEPLVFFIQNFAANSHWSTPSAPPTGGEAPAAAPAPPKENTAFTQFLAPPKAPPNFCLPWMLWTLVERIFGVSSMAAPQEVASLPSATYDNVWVAGRPAGADTHPQPATATQDPHGGLVTSDQCLGCHDAGATGLQFDMTEPSPDGKLLLNHSPYGSWRTSPMGMAGRDPIFYAQLASEVDKFHPQSTQLIEDTCFGCHGILGQRRFAVEGVDPGQCRSFSRSIVDAIPYPDDNPTAALARYGALARDGVSCQACHRIALGDADMSLPENNCAAQRQKLLNPDNRGFAKTFTGSFFVVPGDTVNGPFPDPKPKPMQNALGITPHEEPGIKSSELCGSCHTVHLPVLADGKTLGRFYEQTTYAEWAFSGYRAGTLYGGALPSGAGDHPRSCQDCHMPSAEPDGTPFLSKIAGIQEFSNFPQAEHVLGPQDIDLKPREGFAKHVLVGLNMFLVEMAQQFPSVLGLRTVDPMLAQKGLDPLEYTKAAMIDQAGPRTAAIWIGGAAIERGVLSATVTVTNNTGHKFPSGVGFRRAFIEFEALDADGTVLWASGRTNGAGIIVDADGNPIPGELWWNNECSTRLPQAYQPHYQTIERQDQAQIYQELVTAPQAQTTSCEGGAATGQLTTSFLSICGVLKDNRLLPHGYLPLAERVAIATQLGADKALPEKAGKALAEQAGAHGTGDDPAYEPKEGYSLNGSQSVAYRIDLSHLPQRPTTLQATLYYQAIPPYFLQDRFCTSTSDDTRRLYQLTSQLDLNGTRAAGWKLKVVTTGRVSLH
jgi:hypothetical protein